MLIEKFKSGIEKIKNTKIPDRATIFLSALWVWLCVIYYINSLINFILRIIIVNTPDSCIIYSPKLLRNKVEQFSDNARTKKPIIVDAKLGNEKITNKINLLISNFWDEDVGENGGVNVKDLVNLYPKLATSLVWISYIFEIDKKASEMSNEELGKNIKYLFLNIEEDTIYNNANIDEKDDILFGEIPFNK